MEKKEASCGKAHVSTSPSRFRPEALPPLIAGREVVGRKIAVWKPKAGIWRNGTVSDFNSSNLRHMVRYDERGAREEESLNLGRTRFSWLSEPAAGCPSNPTVVQGLTPTGKEAIDHKVKVFWPAMGRWYIGKVSSFDAKTGRHAVQFKDGDKREYMLRHEAVVWLNVPGLNGDEAGPRTGGDLQPAHDRAVKRVADTEQGSCSTGANKGEGKRAGNGEPTSIAKRTRRSAQEAGGDAAKAVTSPCSEAHSQEYRLVGSPPHRNQRADSPCRVSKSAEPATTTFHAHGACNGHGSHNRGEDVGRPGHTPATSSSAADQDIDVVNASSGNPDHGHSSCAGGKEGVKAPNGSAKDTAAGKGDENSLRRHNSAGKRPARRSSGEPSKQAKRGGARCRSSGLDADGNIDLATALETVVGARVGVWWDEDETYYKGDISSFDSYHKRNKISYDDGEEMWVALQRETFTWITPRAFGAGANATMLAAMRCLGAKNATADPRQLAASASEASPRPPTPAAAVLPLLASSPSGTKVRQVSVASADDFAFGPIAAYSAIEAARESAAQANNPKGDAAVGRRLSLAFTGDNSVHKGEVLAYDAEKGRHLVFYDDGEDEWVDLSQQHVTWQEHVRGVTVAHGLPAGTALPKGKAAIGWRIAVYWRDDKAFYAAEIVGFDTATGRHEVEYDDGEEEEVSLTKEKVKWLMPPGVRGTAASESDDYEGADSDEEEDEEDEEEALLRRSRRRGRSAQRRSARQARRRSPSDPPARSVRFRTSRFGREASTPPNTSPYARRQTAHGSLGLYPEDDDDGHASLYGSTRPILAPTRAEARPVFTREVSAERGVRLPGGSRLQGVTRVSIYLSEDTAYDARPEAEKENKPVAKVDAGGQPNATELLAIAEKLCVRTASKREADTDREGSRPRRGASVDMSAVMRRVAMARAEIADRDRLAKMADEEEDDEYERSGVTVPVADASDHKAALLASMASSAFLAPPSLPTPTAYPTPAAGVPTCQSIAGPGALVSKTAGEAGSASEELLTDAAGAALPCAAEAPALSAAMRPPAHLHSPFSSPAIQMLPAGIAEAAQRLMNGGSATVDPALVSATPNQEASRPPAPSQAKDESAAVTDAPSMTETLEEDAAALMEESTPNEEAEGAAAKAADACSSGTMQPDACNGHNEPTDPAAMQTNSPAGCPGNGEAGVDVPVQAGDLEALKRVALLQQMGSGFSIPETPSLGQELRGGFMLPQHMDSLKASSSTAAGGSCRVENAHNSNTAPVHTQAELEAAPEGVIIAQ